MIQSSHTLYKAPTHDTKLPHITQPFLGIRLQVPGTYQHLAKTRKSWHFAVSEKCDGVNTCQNHNNALAAGGGKGGTPRVARQPADPTTATPRVAQTRPTPKTLNRKKLREIFRDPPGFGAKPKKLTKSSKTAQRKCDKTKKLNKRSKKAQNRRRDEKKAPKKLKKSSEESRSKKNAQKKFKTNSE